MSLNFNNSCSNILNTPGFISDVYANIPGIANVAIGTIFIATDTGNIYQSDGSTWYVIGGGGGGSQNLQQVLTVGNETNLGALFKDALGITSNFTTIDYVQVRIDQGSSYIGNQVISGTPSTVMVDTALNQLILTADQLQYIDLNTGKDLYLSYAGSQLNGQTIYLPENNGTISLQDPITVDYDLFLNPPLTISIGAETCFIIYDSSGAGGGTSVDFDPTSWKDGITATLMIETTCLPISVTTSGGALFYGQTLINKEGLVFVKYNALRNAFYSSHY